MVLMNNGTIYAWGRNDAGQLGVGNNNDQYLPTEVMGISNATTKKVLYMLVIYVSVYNAT